jgi:hypothetical protein
MRSAARGPFLSEVARLATARYFSTWCRSRLAGRVGLDDWAYRPASKGRVLASVPDAVIRAFSPRRPEIDHVTAGLVAQYRAERGHDPTRRALTSMRQHAAQLTRKGKPEGALDCAQALRDWERVSRTTELGTLRTLARRIWHRAGDAPEPEPLTAEQARAAMAAALAARARSRPVDGFS